MIKLDLNEMWTDRVAMCKSISDMLLLPNVVEVKYLHSIQVMPYGITLYRRTTEQEYSERAHTIRCVDPAVEDSGHPVLP